MLCYIRRHELCSKRMTNPTCGWRLKSKKNKIKPVRWSRRERKISKRIGGMDDLNTRCQSDGCFDRIKNLIVVDHVTELCADSLVFTVSRCDPLWSIYQSQSMGLSSTVTSYLFLFHFILFYSFIYFNINSAHNPSPYTCLIHNQMHELSSAGPEWLRRHLSLSLIPQQTITRQLR